jgi:hypothetical protein
MKSARFWNNGILYTLGFFRSRNKTVSEQTYVLKNLKCKEGSVDKMKHENNGLMTAYFFALVCFGSSLYAAIEPNVQDIQLSKEKMNQLREVYKEVQQAEAELQQLIEEAERKEPLLRPTKEALKKMRDFLEAQDHQRFQGYLNNAKDCNEAYRLYEHCKAIFSQNKTVKLLGDPNQEKLVKKPMIYYFRNKAPKELITSITSIIPQFEPNEPNDERLWQNIKEIYFKKMPDEYLQRERKYYIEKRGVPEWLPDYAANMAFADGMINCYEGGIYLLTPQEVCDTEKRVDKLYSKIGRIYAGWSKMRHLLATENNPDNEAVICAVQEHMRLFRTER